jgi:hypothetical protein
LTQVVICDPVAIFGPPPNELDTWLRGYKQAEKLSNDASNLAAQASCDAVPRGNCLKNSRRKAAGLC